MYKQIMCVCVFFCHLTMKVYVGGFLLQEIEQAAIAVVWVEMGEPWLKVSVPCLIYCANDKNVGRPLEWIWRDGSLFWMRKGVRFCIMFVCQLLKIFSTWELKKKNTQTNKAITYTSTTILFIINMAIKWSSCDSNNPKSIFSVLLPTFL